MFGRLSAIVSSSAVLFLFLCNTIYYVVKFHFIPYYKEWRLRGGNHFTNFKALSWKNLGQQSQLLSHMNITILLLVKSITPLPLVKRGHLKRKWRQYWARVQLQAKPTINPLKQLMPEAMLGQRPESSPVMQIQMLLSAGIQGTVVGVIHKPQRRGKSNQNN